MTGTRIISEDAERRELAGEIALGLISDADAKVACARDPMLFDDVLKWQHQLGGLALEAPDRVPSPAAWHAIQMAISPQPRLPDQVPTAPAGWLSRLAASLGFWRGLSAAGFATAAAAIAFALLRVPAPVAPDQPHLAGMRDSPAIVERILLVSSLMPRDGPPVYVATYDAERSRLVLVPAATAASAAGVPYLWLVPDDSGEPVGVGQLDPDNPVAIDLGLTLAKSANASAGLVITLEIAGGDIGTVPRGPVIAHGKFSKF